MASSYSRYAYLVPRKNELSTKECEPSIEDIVSYVEKSSKEKNMGNWNITVQGVGCHHNGKAEIDADLAAVEFVEKLRKQGHTITSATFTYGGSVDLEKKSIDNKIQNQD
jgi:hypothetical protein